MPTKHDIATNTRKAMHWIRAALTPARVFILILVLTTIVLGFVFSDVLGALRAPIHAHPYLGIGIFIFVLMFVTVFPIASSLPLLPIAGAVWGLLIGGAFATLGWWVGGLITFAIARWLRRPVLDRYVSIRKMDAWQEKLPDDINFRGIVVARILLPPGIPGYAVGLMQHISATEFALAMLIGGIPMSFLLVGLGSALANNNFMIFIAYSLGIVLLLSISYFALWRRWKKNKEAQK